MKWTEGSYVAINAVECTPEFRAQFEELFRTRAGLVERMPGFLGMWVLRPRSSDAPYLVLTLWESEEHFRAWLGSEQFRRGHARVVSLLRAAHEAGRAAPMHAALQLYEVLLSTGPLPYENA